MRITRCFIAVFLSLVVGCSDSKNHNAAGDSTDVTSAAPADVAECADVLDDEDDLRFSTTMHLKQEQWAFLEKVRKMTDPAEVADIAKNDEDPFKRHAAVWRLTNRTLLTDIAKHDPNWGVRAQAVGKLVSPNWLYKIEEPEEDARVKAWHRDNQVLLAEIAKQDEKNIVRLRAVQGLTDQRLLADIAENDADEMVRGEARATLHDLRKEE